MGKLLSISLTTICKWATSNLLWLFWQISQVGGFFPCNQSVSERRTERLPIKVFTLAHLANAFVWNLKVIQQSWQLLVKWRETGVKAWRLYYGCLRLQKALPWLERRDLTVYKSVCLKVNRSEEVPQPHDPQVWLDISIYSLCPWQRHSWQIERENKRADCASDDDLKGICWRRIIAWLNVSSVADSVCLWCLKCLCWCVSQSVGIYFNYIASLHCWPAVESNQF